MQPTGCQDMAFVNDTGKECLLSLDAVTLWSLPKQVNTVYVTGSAKSTMYRPAQKLYSTLLHIKLVVTISNVTIQSRNWADET